MTCLLIFFLEPAGGGFLIHVGEAAENALFYRFISLSNKLFKVPVYCNDRELIET